MGRHGLRLGELIDLELQLRADDELTPTQVAQRDARIAGIVQAGKLPPAEVYRRWLRRSDRGGGPTVGQRVEQVLEMMSAAAVFLGLVLGGGVVWGWVAAHLQRPINVLHFWTVVVGIQLALLAVLVLFVLLPMPWLERVPGVQSTLMLGRAVSRLLPALAGWTVLRIFPQHKLAVEQAAGELKKSGRLYGRLRMLMAIKLTQTFAVAFNIAAVASLVLAAYVTDPAFGWRSARLEEPQVHRLAQVMATPWAWAWPASVPDSVQVEQTKFTLLEQRFGVDREAQPQRPWGAWWPFLVASLLVYGLIPRALIWLALWIMIHLELHRFVAHHPGLLRLRDRLSRAVVRTQATEPEQAAPGMDLPAGGSTQSHLTGSQYHVLRWGGVALDEGQVRQWLREYHHAEPVGIYPVGGADAAPDSLAMAAVADDPQRRPVLVLVGAWEPPTGDYLDFLTELRRRLGERRMLHVMLYQSGSGGWLRSAKPAQVRLWKAKAAALADPWLDVEPMIQGAGA